MRASAILIVAAFGMLIGGTGLAEAQRAPPSGVDSRVPPVSEAPPADPSRPAEASRPGGGGGGDVAPQTPQTPLFVPNVIGPALACHPIKKAYQAGGFGGAIPPVIAWALIVTNVSNAILQAGTTVMLSAGSWTSSVQLGGLLIPGGYFEVNDPTLGSPAPYGQANYDACTAFVL